MEFYPSERGGLVMAYHSYEYICKRILNGVIHWRCRHHISSKCNSRMRTLDQSYEVISEPTEHCHDPFPQKIKINITTTKKEKTKKESYSARVTPKKELGSVPHEMMEFYPSERGGLVMAYQGHEYIRRRVLNGVIHWRCRQHISLKCYSRMRTFNQSYEVITEPTEHSHDSFPQKIKVNIALTRMKEEISSSGATSKEVLGSVLHEMKLSEEVQLHMPKKSSIQRTMNRVKARQVVNIPNPAYAQFPIPAHFMEDMLPYNSGEGDPDQILAVGDKEVLPSCMQT